MSTLLLDDALKPATQLTYGVINEMLLQFAVKTLDILQGSVATHWDVMGSLVIVLLQIVSWFWQ